MSSKEKMTIAVYGRSFSDEFSENIKELFKKLQSHQLEVHIFEPFLKYTKNKALFDPLPQGTFTNSGDLNKNTDFVLSIGGDGTILESVSLVRNSGIPIIGINTGKLGFLASIAKEEINDAVESIIEGEFEIEKRGLIQMPEPAGVFGDFNYGLNEVTIQKNDSRMISIHTYLDGEFLNSYWADGLIISTPTGSTAYSLSVGGPIITPDSGVFIISPIAPHNLTVRPVVIPDNKEITLEIDKRHSNFLLSMDFNTAQIENNKKITLKKAPFYINLVNLKKHNFYSTLRNKLMWGVDKRN